MNTHRIVRIITFMVLCLIVQSATWAADLREVSQKARAAYEAARTQAEARKAAILQDRQALSRAVENERGQVAALKARLRALSEESERLAARETAAAAAAAEVKTDLAGYAGVVRQAARDLSTLLTRSHFTARDAQRLEALAAVVDPERFPGLAAVTVLTDRFLEEMRLTGEVDCFEGDFIDGDGQARHGRMLTLGPFTAAYTAGGRVGFVRYSEADRQFKAITEPPGWAMRRNLAAYMAGKAEAVYLDPSAGTALSRVAHRVGLWEKLRQGGILVWPILALGLAALLLTVERLLFLNRVHANTDRLMGRVNELAAQGQWSQCHDTIAREKDRPVHNVLKAGLAAVNEARETLENILQEAILKELPRLSRFLPALSVMAAVAPLLGLLGTVTGMIGTFQVITLYGTGDPRLMAGGISEALVTTMVGLAVAIPVMLIHTFLKRRVEHIVGDMEEKALALSNIICRECNFRSPAARPAAGAVR